MALNDVWRTIGDDVKFFYEENFDDVPTFPGVYAWFYPLRILSPSQAGLETFIGTVQNLFNYDPIDKGPPIKDTELSLTWWHWAIRAGRRPKPLQFSDTFRRAWKEITANEEFFSDFQRSLLKASIFMPPLYVGKADNLNNRCAQHLRGADGKNDFHCRFEEFANRLNQPNLTVRKLLFACVRTESSVEEGGHSPSSQVHELVEDIMNCLCAPPYGMR